jgi:hypothetical protein
LRLLSTLDVKVSWPDLRSRNCLAEIQAGDHTITAADPLPDDLRGALDRIHRSSYAH